MSTTTAPHFKIDFPERQLSAHNLIKEIEFGYISNPLQFQV